MGTRCAAKHNNGHTLGFCVNIIHKHTNTNTQILKYKIMARRCTAKHKGGHTLGFCVNIIFEIAQVEHCTHCSVKC